MSACVINSPQLLLDHKNIRPPEVHCVCCLAKNLSYVRLEKCKYTHFLLEFLTVKLEVDIRAKVICIYCHRFIQKIEKFREIALNNIYFTHSKTSTETSTCLKKTALCIVNVLPRALKKYTSNCKPILKNVIVKDPLLVTQETSESDQTECKLEKIDMKTEKSIGIEETKLVQVKLELEENGASGMAPELNDFLDDPTPSIAPKEEKIPKKTDEFKNPAQANVKDSERFYVGKMNVVMLSLEQALAEIEAAKQSPAYADREFRCDKCVKGFTAKLTLERHMAKHDAMSGSFLCTICHTFHNSEAGLKVHRKRHFTRFECAVCKQRFISNSSCGIHYNNTHAKEHGILAFGHTCSVCDFVTHSYLELRKHNRKEHNDSFHECKECFKRFSSAYGCRVHVRNVHGNEKPVYKCNVCGRVSSSRSNLKLHMYVKHSKEGTEGNTYCADCKVAFKNPLTLASHFKKHSKHAKKEMKFTCDYCGGKFPAKHEVQIHIYSKHIPVHQCPVCSKALSTPNALRRHVDLVHLGKKPPKDKICHYCGKGFATNTVLQTHIRTHTLERPLQCPHCPATFGHSAARYTHIKLLHNPDRVRKPRKTKEKQFDKKQSSKKQSSKKQSSKKQSSQKLIDINEDDILSSSSAYHSLPLEVELSETMSLSPEFE